ncbi:hypothetical protein D3C75_1039830 [compost metagenome]
MAWAVGDEADLAGIRLPVSPRAKLIEQRTYTVDDVEVGHFVPAADVVHLTHLPCFQHTADGAAVVFDV